MPTAKLLTSNWLAGLLDQAIGQNLCVSVYCTTCGARPFRRKLKSRADFNARRRGLEGEMLMSPAHVELVQQLKLLEPDEQQARQWLDPVRLIFTDLTHEIAFGGVPGMLSDALEGTWSGSVLEDMQQHHARRRASSARHERENSPRVIEERQAEKKRKKQVAHAERLKKKAEINRRWFEKHPELLERCLEIRRQRAEKRARRNEP